MLGEDEMASEDPQPKPPTGKTSSPDSTPDVGEPELGRLLGRRYQIGRRIGLGGFGAVFEAEDVRLRKRVAVKVLSHKVGRSPEALLRFEREAIAASQIGHAGIVDVTDFDHDEDGTHYIVMEILEGTDLRTVIAQGPLPVARALFVAAQIADALGAAHDKGIIHRDLKPANVYLTAPAGRSDFVKVLDFGISKVQRGTHDPSTLTLTGQVLGTPSYMAPEQFTANRSADERADVYALGCILYEMLTGRQPFVGDDHLAVLARHLTEDPTPPSLIEAGVAPEVDALVLRALARQPESRFQSMAVFSEGIRVILATADPARAASLQSPRPTGSMTPTLRAPSLATTIQRGGLAQDKPLRWQRWGAGAAVVFLLLGAVLLGRQKADPPAPVVVTAAAAPVRPGPEPTPPPPAPRPSPTVELHVESEPPGADVFRASDGVRIGRTPLLRTIPRGEGEAMFLVRLAGHRDEEVVLPANRDGRTLVKLTRTPARPRLPSFAPAAEPAPSTAAAKPAAERDTVNPFGD